jgi:hypothetical protein
MGAPLPSTKPASALRELVAAAVVAATAAVVAGVVAEEAAAVAAVVTAVAVVVVVVVTAAVAAATTSGSPNGPACLSAYSASRQVKSRKLASIAPRAWRLARNRVR